MGLFGKLIMLDLFQKFNPQHNENTPATTEEVAKVEKLRSFASACQNGDLGNVKKLLSKDKELVNQQFPIYGQTGLQVAVSGGHRSIVLHLLKNGANLELADNDGDDPLHYAVLGNKPLIIEDLIKAGITLNTVNKKGKTPILVAAIEDYLDCVKMLVKYKANINVQDNSGSTPLHYAIVNGNDEMLELLLSVPDVDVTLKTQHRISILATAVFKDDFVATRRILKKAPELVNEKDGDGEAALHFCCTNNTGNNVEMMKVLIEEGRAEIDIRDNNMRTPLHLAAIGGFVKNIEYLIKCGAKLSAKDSDGDTPLHVAIIAGNNTVIDLLIGVPGIDLNIENKDGFCAFHLAAFLVENSYAFEKFLEKAPHIVNYQRKTDDCAALHLASITNRYKVMKGLIEKGQANTEITSLGLCNSTPLHFAVQEGHCGIIELLVTHQANVNAENSEGYTPLHVLLATKAKNFTKLKCHQDSPKIASIWNHLLTVGWKSENKDLPYAAVCCFLVSAGANYDTKKNSRGQTVKDLVSRSRRFKNILNLYATDPKLKISFDVVPETADTGSGSGSGASSNNEVKVNEAARGECLACSEVAVLIQFEPCEHRVVCEPCSFRLKRCFDCKTPIQRKVTGDGKEVAEMNANCCSICTVKKKNVIFLCGHSACEECSDALINCHLCRCLI